jgi:hypothetical protein
MLAEFDHCVILLGITGCVLTFRNSNLRKGEGEV